MLNLRSPISDQIGYGIVSYNIFKSIIQDHNQEICWFPIGQPSISDTKYHPILQQAVKNQDNFNPNSPTISIWHEHSLHERFGKGLNAGMPFFELRDFAPRTKNSLSSQDKILVASEWAKEIINKEVPNLETVVIPMGVDSGFYTDIKVPTINRPYRFLTVGKIEIRKGHDILHELFNKAFHETDDVELYISWDNPFLSPSDKQQWIDMYKNTPLGDKIHFVNRMADLRQLYMRCDCCIFPTRAEAICLPALEAMSCNKPVIITNYSGQTEFCNKDNSFLVDIDEMEPAYDGIWFDGSSEWAKLGDKQQIQFIEYMQHCYKNRINENVEGRKTAEKLTWKNTTNKILEVLK